MTTLSQDLQDKLRRLNVFEKIIIINIVIFLIGWFLFTFRHLPREESLRWLELPKSFSGFITKPWAIFTYGFTHYGFFHILFNLLVLYFVPRTMVNLFSTKLSLNILLRRGYQVEIVHAPGHVQGVCHHEPEVDLGVDLPGGREICHLLG